MVSLILETGKQQKRFCQMKGDKNFDSDYEVILNARGPKVTVLPLGYQIVVM